MAGKAAKGKATRSTTNVTQSSRAGLTFPVGRTSRYLKQGRYSERFGIGGAIFLAAVLEYLTVEILELAGNATHEHGRKTIAPRHLQLAIRNDEELNKLLATSQISDGGVMANVNSFLFPKKAGMKGSKEAEATQEM